MLLNYLRKYQEDPTSKVFAPLAEAYRKAGLVDEAIEIAREGLQIHPGFISGRVALGRALFDKKMYQEVINQLEPIIQDSPDNLIAQKLLAESYLVFGRIVDALGCYKMLMFFSPSDRELSNLVNELEMQVYRDGALVLRKDPKEVEKEAGGLISIRTASEAISDSPEIKRKVMIKKVEMLQRMLQKVERYRSIHLL